MTDESQWCRLLAGDQQFLQQLADEIGKETTNREHQATEHHEIKGGHLLGLRPAQVPFDGDFIPAGIDIVFGHEMRHRIAAFSSSDDRGETRVAMDESIPAEQLEDSALV